MTASSVLLALAAPLGHVLISQRTKSNIQTGIADPHGSALYHHYKYGELKSEGGSVSEGIGQGRITANLQDVTIDRAYQISDEEALPIIYDLMQHEGLYLGGSSP